MPTDAAAGGSFSVLDASTGGTSSDAGPGAGGALVLQPFGPGVTAGPLSAGTLTLERASFGRATMCSGSMCITGGFGL
jgi:hypothetical protein